MITEQTRTFSDVFCLSLDWRVRVISVLETIVTSMSRVRSVNIVNLVDFL